MDESKHNIGMNRTFSEKLYAILDNIGFTDEFRKWSLEVVKTQEMLINPGLFGKSKILVHYTAGSIVDGTFRASLGSDTDYLSFIEDFPVGDEVESDVAYFAVYDENTLPGYVNIKANLHAKTKRINMFYSSYVNEAGIEYLTNQQKNTDPFNLRPTFVERSGPAFTLTSNLFSMDQVYALRSCSWPQIAQEWFQRPRCHGWPSEDSIEAMRTMGYFVVPTGHPYSKDTKRHDLEWRLSFTRQETHLMVNLTDVQYKCYVLLKMIKQDIIIPSMGKSLSSYHCKTSLFYTIEENDPGIWRRDNLTVCVYECLRRLLDWAGTGFCPNYFLPQSNLFHGKIDSKEMPKLVEILRKTLKNLSESFENIECERLGEWIQYIDSTVCDHDREKSLQESANQSLFVAVSYLFANVAVMVILIFSSSLKFSLMVGVVDGHLQLLHILESYYNQIDSSIRESLTPAISYLHSSLASHLASLSIHAVPAVRDWYVCASALHFMYATELEDIISRLKLATVLYMTGHNHSAKQTLKDMAQYIKAVEIFCGLRDSYSQNNDSLLSTEIKKIIRMPISQVLKKISVGPIVFLPGEMDMTPHALRFEMFRSIATPSFEDPVALHRFCYYYSWAVADADIFYHLLCFQTGLYNNYAELQSFYAIYQVNNHIDTWWNIIGWIAKQSKRIHDAATAFYISWVAHRKQIESPKMLYKVDDNQYMHNAAKLHMLVLLYDIWKNDYSLENE